MSANLLSNILNHDDIAEIFVDYLNYETVLRLSKVSKVVRKLYDFRALLERKTVRFVNGITYISTPTGWCNHIFKFTIERKDKSSKMVTFALKGDKRKSRKKIRFQHGIEYLQIGKSYKSGCIWASDRHSAAMDANILAENSYWHMYK